MGFARWHYLQESKQASLRSTVIERNKKVAKLPKAMTLRLSLAICVSSNTSFNSAQFRVVMWVVFLGVVHLGSLF